jgi:molybdopterin converting factor small subunit
VTEAIAAILKRCPALRPHWWDSTGELHAHVHVILNGEDTATLPAGLNSIVHPQDTLDFFPPVAGGKG